MSAFSTSAASAVAAFINLRREHVVRPDKILRSDQPQTWILTELMKSGFRQTLDYGDPIVGFWYPQTASNFTQIIPGQTRAPVDVAAPVRFAIGRTYSENSRKWTDAEIKITGGTASELKACYQKYKLLIDSDLEGEHKRRTEGLFTAAPSAAMEQTGVPLSPPQSISQIICEESSGIPTGSGLTTIQGINPTTYSGWKPQRETYDPNNITDDALGLWNAFTRITKKCMWEPVPGGMGEMYKETGKAKKFFATNLDGDTVYARIMKGANDYTRAGANDPSYMGNNYFGIPIKYIKGYDDAFLDSTSATAYSRAWQNGQPRFQLIDTEYLYFKADPEKWMWKSPAREISTLSYDAYAQFMRTDGNLLTHARERLGIIVPNTVA
jgi:hypothetical protein